MEWRRNRKIKRAFIARWPNFHSNLMNECVYLWSFYIIMTSSKFWLQYSNIQDVSKKLWFCFNILESTFDLFHHSFNISILLFSIEGNVSQWFCVFTFFRCGRYTISDLHYYTLGMMRRKKNGNVAMIRTMENKKKKRKKRTYISWV